MTDSKKKMFSQSSPQSSSRSPSRSFALIWTLSAGVWLAPSGLFAAPDASKTAVEKYRVESNYGPEIAVLNPAFPRDGKLELSFGGTYSPFSSLMQYSAANAGMVIHLNRRHALEPIFFGYHFSRLSSFAENELGAKTSSSLRSSKSVEVPKMSFATSYLFSPYYSKMHITERTVAHFDVYLGLGLALLKNEQLFLDGYHASSGSSTANSQDAQIWRTGGAFSAGVRFLFPHRWGLRAELRDYMHQSRNFGQDSWSHTLQISLSASLFFGAFPD